MSKYSESAHARHGGAYDRGSADAYYGRPKQPHYYTGDSYQSQRLEAEDMSPEELEAYNAGYDEENTRKEYE